MKAYFKFMTALYSTSQIFNQKCNIETLPKALRTQVLTALTSNFGLVGLVQGRRQKKMGICGKNFQTSKFALNPDLLNCFLEIWYILYGTW